MTSRLAGSPTNFCYRSTGLSRGESMEGGVGRGRSGGQEHREGAPRGSALSGPGIGPDPEREDGSTGRSRGGRGGF